MPTLDELRGVIAHRKYVYDSHLMDMPVNWENIAAMVSGIADAQNEYIDAQQQRIDALTKALEELYDAASVVERGIPVASEDWHHDLFAATGNAYHVLHADEGGAG